MLLSFHLVVTRVFIELNGDLAVLLRSNKMLCVPPSALIQSDDDSRVLGIWVPPYYNLPLDIHSETLIIYQHYNNAKARFDSGQIGKPSYRLLAQH